MVSTSTLLLDRLLLNANIDMTKPFYWIKEGVTAQEVQVKFKKGAIATQIPHGDNFKYPVVQRDKQYHIARVIYFIEHPSEIKDIEIDNVCEGLCYIYPQARVIDGWHRLMAAYILGFSTIKVFYCGRTDLL